MDSERRLEIGGFTLRRLRLPTGDVIQITGPTGGVYCDDSMVMYVLFGHIAAQAERIKALEGRPPWETTEACAEALREQLAARVEDAKIADELATNLSAVMSGYQDHDVTIWETAEASLARYDATKEDPNER